MRNPESRSPIGHPTRGKTARNRLRRVDLFIARFFPNLIKEAQDNYFVDLGFGADPTTTLESAHHLRKLNPTLPILGVELDPERVAAAKPYEDPLTQFKVGGFNIPLPSNRQACLIRAFNVLRQYEQDQVGSSYAEMEKALMPGGIIIEGTSDPFGRIWTANLIQKTDGAGLVYLGITFSTNFRWGFSPSLFPPVLPKNLIHKMIAGEEINQFFTDWEASTVNTIAHKAYGIRQWFVESGNALAEMGYQIDTRKKMLKSGFLTWKSPPLTWE
ncbi:hypothetical protein KQH54_01840 [bacterium]|nr:hypothetical protein [bacterium]